MKEPARIVRGAQKMLSNVRKEEKICAVRLRYYWRVVRKVLNVTRKIVDTLYILIKLSFRFSRASSEEKESPDRITKAVQLGSSRERSRRGQESYIDSRILNDASWNRGTRVEQLLPTGKRGPRESEESNG